MPRLPGRATVPGVLVVALAVAGCGGPSDVERENRKAFEMLLTAVTLRNAKELEKDAARIEERHSGGQLSEARRKDLLGIIEKARAGHWEDAEKMAYEFREERPFFK